MTTIVWDGKCLCGDTKRSLDNGLSIDVQKVFKINKPKFDLIANNHLITKHVSEYILVGSAGNSSTCVAFVESLKGLQEKQISDKSLYSFSSIIVTDNGKIFQIDDSMLAVDITDVNKYSIGSGSCYAIAAMECGKSAEEAIKIASKFDSNTSEYSYSVSFDNA